MKKSEWKKKIKGFYIADCAIRDEDVAYLIMFENSGEYVGGTDERWRLVSWGPEAIRAKKGTDESCLVSYFNNLYFPSLSLQHKPEQKVVLCDSWGYCFVAHEGEEKAPFLKQKMRTLWGEVYVAGSGGVYKRDGIQGTWVALDMPPKMIADRAKGKRLKYVIEDFDAYSPEEFYILNENGALFYTDNGVWKKVALKKAGYPKARTGAICCGPDGNVYIFAKGEDGSKIFQGRKDKWEIIWSEPYGGTHSVEMLAYQDYVLIMDYGVLSKIKDGEITPLAIPFECTSFSVHENLLMIASGSEAAIFNGEEWKVIVSPHFNKKGVYKRKLLKPNETESETHETSTHLDLDEVAERLDKVMEVIDSLDEDEMEIFREIVVENIAKSYLEGA